jgi:hypothetical protein
MAQSRAYRWARQRACRNNAAEIDVYDIADRIRALVNDGKLEAQGNLYFWRNSEVRLPRVDQEPERKIHHS